MITRFIYTYLSLGVWEYIQHTRDLVHDLEVRVQKAKDNVDKLQKLMATWSKTPLFERKVHTIKSKIKLNLYFLIIYS